jgi:thiamine pyrophosphokinase
VIERIGGDTSRTAAPTSARPTPGAPAAGRHALVFAGGDPVPAGALAGLPAKALVVAADSGADHALASGRAVDVLVGDLDSISPSSLEQVRRSGGVVERHRPDKDATDLALALDVALERGAAHITVVGGHGGRLDHLLGNVLLLAAERYAGVLVDARLGSARVLVVRGRRAFEGRAGDLVSLLPLGGAAGGVSTEGLLFPLHEAQLSPGTTWGISNQLVAEQAAVTVARGVLLVVLPGQPGAL